MLSRRLRNLAHHMTSALQSMVERGRIASAVVLAIMAAVTARQTRLETLMDRFEAGLLRTRVPGLRREVARTTRRPPPVRPTRAWPEHRPFWLNLVGFNNPSIEVRMRWNRGELTRGLASVQQLVAFRTKLRALLEEDAMRGLLAASREARRIVRWLLRASDDAALPAILHEPRKTRTRGETSGSTGPRRAGQPDAGRRTPAPPRPPGPFEVPPENLLREEREARGMWVKPPIMLFDAAAVPFTPTEWQRQKTWLD